MSGHTPAPWTSRPSYHGGNGKTRTGTIIDSETRMILSGQPAASMGEEEMAANGALMAAAPKLLSELKHTAESLRRYDGLYKNSLPLRRAVLGMIIDAEKVIEEAEGRTDAKERQQAEQLRSWGVPPCSQS